MIETIFIGALPPILTATMAVVAAAIAVENKHNPGINAGFTWIAAILAFAALLTAI